MSTYDGDTRATRSAYGRKTSHCDGCGKQRTDVRAAGPGAEIGLCWVCRKEGEKGRYYSHRAERYVHPGQGDRSRRDSVRAPGRITKRLAGPYYVHLLPYDEWWSEPSLERAKRQKAITQKNFPDGTVRILKR